jgi:hypothetical protein
VTRENPGWRVLSAWTQQRALYSLLSSIWEDLGASVPEIVGIVEELEVLHQVLPQLTCGFGIQGYNHLVDKSLVKATRIKYGAWEGFINLKGVHAIDIATRLGWVGKEDVSCGIRSKRCSRSMKVFREATVLEEKLGGDHIKLASLSSSLATVDEEARDERGLTVCGSMTEPKHRELRIVGDGLLDAVESKLGGNCVIEETVPVDHAEVLELEVLVSFFRVERTTYLNTCSNRGALNLKLSPKKASARVKLTSPSNVPCLFKPPTTAGAGGSGPVLGVFAPMLRRSYSRFPFRR